MQAYISVSYSKRKVLDDEVNAIIESLNNFKILSFVFVDKYKFVLHEEKEMMRQAMADIDNSNFLIAETSDKGIGIGIEVGYAKAKGKPIIYLRKQNAEHSTTVSGVSDYQIIYQDTLDLKKQLKEIIIKVTSLNTAL